MSVRFTLEERYQIRDHLNFALLRNPTIQQYSDDFYMRELYVSQQFKPPLLSEREVFHRLDFVEQYSVYKVEHIRAVLGQLNAAESEIAEEMGANYSLYRVGELEWDKHTKTAGLERKRDTLIERLRYFLDLPMSPPSAWGGSVVRS